jgi:hypothetical protein
MPPGYPIGASLLIVLILLTNGGVINPRFLGVDNIKMVNCYMR